MTGNQSVDPRLKLIEESRGAPLSDDLREATLQSTKGSDEQWAEARRRYAVPDQTEPDFVFRPVPAPVRKHPDRRGRGGKQNG